VPGGYTTLAARICSYQKKTIDREEDEPANPEEGLGGERDCGEARRFYGSKYILGPKDKIYRVREDLKGLEEACAVKKKKGEKRRNCAGPISAKDLRRVYRGGAF